MSSISAGTTLGTGLVSEGDTTGELVLKTNGGTTAVTIGTDQSVTFAGAVSTSGAVSATTLTVNSNNISADNSLGFRNRIINGDMRIDQRNAGAAVTPTSGGYTLDRFTYQLSQASKATIQQNAGSVTPPAGFSNYLGVTSTSAYSSGSSDFFRIYQPIEGFNVADLAWGTASAKTVTLSFWVRSSLTGTFGGALQNSASNRSYPYTYTISSADTWEQKSITIAGDTTGTWLTTNGVGVIVGFNLGTGTTFSGTAGAWAGANYLSATGATSVVGTNGATLYITGVQLEVGSVATPFERRPYGTELALCQRYYYRIKADAGGQVLGSGMMQTATAGRFFIPFMVPMRTSPSALEQSGTASNYVVFNGGSAQNCDAVPTFNSATLYGAGLQATIASGGTIGYGALIRSDSSAAYLGWSAEL